MNHDPSKVKVLFTGPLENVDACTILLARLTTLQASKAGPFDVAFGLIRCNDSETARSIMDKIRDHNNSNADQDNKTPMVDIYLQDSSCLQSVIRDAEASDAATSVDPKLDNQQAPCVKLAEHLYILRDRNAKSNLPMAGIWNIAVGSKRQQHLVVASLPTLFRMDDSAHKTFQETIQHVSYTGCDVLISSEWPQGIETLIWPENGGVEIPTSTKALLSFDVADVALKARAKYHVSVATPNPTDEQCIFRQSPAFRHVRATTSTVRMHTGRFLALCHINTDKNKKCIHAVGIVPLHAHGANDTSNAVEYSKAVPCPFTDAVYPVDLSSMQPQSSVGSSNYQPNRNVGLSDAAARRILADDRRKRAKRPFSGTNEEEHDFVDPENTKLFLHGLHHDVTGRLQGDEGNQMIRTAFAKYGAVNVIFPPGAGDGNTSSFCFVEFSSHEKASTCLDELGGEIVIGGVTLIVKWSKGTPGKRKESGTKPKRHRLTESEAQDSTALYFTFAIERTDITDETPTLEKFSEELRKWMEWTLERALAGDDCNEEDMIKASDEPALQVKVRLPARKMETKPFGFLDFASHAAASMALATVTGSTDGGRAVPDQQLLYNEKSSNPSSLVTRNDLGIYLYWADPKMEQMKADGTKDIIEDKETGFKFERKHFPADSRQDCWFCLASPSCEKNLLTGVYNTCYTAMPKGPVHPGHILLIPVQHSSEGALMDPKLREEIDGLKHLLRKHASIAYDSDLFVYERAIQTRGGYHTHVQCIPVERKLGTRIQATMMAQANNLKLDLREVNTDVGIQALLNDDSDSVENYCGYFYAEIPFGGEYKRFLYRAKEDDKSKVPMQFGREVLAAVLGKPDLAHWKSCVLDEENEKLTATAFRESFQKIYSP
jgi:diadenosine tetraphosphate (Ap4A) HIT family hydrolase